MDSAPGGAGLCRRGPVDARGAGLVLRERRPFSVLQQALYRRRGGLYAGAGRRVGVGGAGRGALPDLDWHGDGG